MSNPYFGTLIGDHPLSTLTRQNTTFKMPHTFYRLVYLWIETTGKIMIDPDRECDEVVIHSHCRQFYRYCKINNHGSLFAFGANIHQTSELSQKEADEIITNIYQGGVCMPFSSDNDVHMIILKCEKVEEE